MAGSSLPPDTANHDTLDESVMILKNIYAGLEKLDFFRDSEVIPPEPVRLSAAGFPRLVRW